MDRKLSCITHILISLDKGEVTTPKIIRGVSNGYEEFARSYECIAETKQAENHQRGILQRIA